MQNQDFENQGKDQSRSFINEEQKNQTQDHINNLGLTQSLNYETAESQNNQTQIDLVYQQFVEDMAQPAMHEVKSDHDIYQINHYN